MAKTIELCIHFIFLTYFAPYLSYVSALPCETQMHQIVIFRCDCSPLHYQFNRGCHM